MAVNSNNGASGGGKGIRAGKAFVELTADDAGLRKRLNEVRLRVMKFGVSMAKVGGGIGAIGAGIMAPLAGAIKSATDRGVDLQRLATKLGVSTEQLSEFAYAAGTTGEDLEKLGGHFENLAERVMQGSEGAGEAAETFKKLGLDASQLKLQNPIDQLISIAAAMDRVTNETDRLGMLSSLGGDQFQNLNALFKQGPAGIRALMQEAKEVGASMSGDTAKKATEAQLAFNRVLTAGKSIIWEIGAALLEYVDDIKAVAAWIVNGVKVVRGFIAENKALVGTIAAVGAGLFAAGSAFIAIGGTLALGATAVGGFVSAISAIGTVLSAIATPAGLVVAAVVAVGAAIAGATYAFFKFTDAGQAMAQIFGDTFRAISSTAKTAFGGIADAIKKGDMQLALSIAGKGLRVIWNDLIIGMKKAWMEFIGWMVEYSNFGMIANAGTKLAKAVGADGLAQGFTDAKNFGKQSFLEMLGFDLTQDLKHANDLKRQLEQLVAMAKPKPVQPQAQPLSAYSHGNFKDYLPKIMDSVQGLFNAPSLNRALGVGKSVTTDKAIKDTAANTGRLVEIEKDKKGVAFV